MKTYPILTDVPQQLILIARYEFLPSVQWDCLISKLDIAESGMADISKSPDSEPVAGGPQEMRRHFPFVVEISGNVQSPSETFHCGFNYLHNFVSKGGSWNGYLADN